MNHIVREVAPNVFTEVPIGASITVGDTLHPWQVTECWSDAELATIGIYRVAPITVPKGKHLLSFTFERSADDVIAVGAFEDIPVSEPYTGAIIVDASSAKLVLDDDGLYAAVADICESHPVTAVRIFWESANTWAEDNPYVLAIGTEFNLSAEAIHSMFQRALLK
jgi:hypothetical protein